MKLDKTKVYDLSELTNEERKEVEKTINTKTYDFPYLIYLDRWVVCSSGSKFSTEVTNAKELFYTLENIQVDCRDLSEEKIEYMKEVVVKNGYTLWDCKTAFELCDLTYYFVKNNGDTDFLLSINSTDRYTITYEKFMELFSTQCSNEEVLQPHYDNTNGSIYKFCNDQKLNSWEFDIIKRVVRCRKKGLFKEDLQKTKDLIDLYLKEFTDEK